MAIIRKGDKEAEDALRKRANQQPPASERRVASRKKTAVDNMRINPDGTAKKSYRWGDNDKPYAGGGVSGKAIAEIKDDAYWKRFTKNTRTPARMTGVIQSGKLVKGGNISLSNSLYRKKKQQEFDAGHDGAKG